MKKIKIKKLALLGAIAAVGISATAIPSHAAEQTATKMIQNEIELVSSSSITSGTYAANRNKNKLYTTDIIDLMVNGGYYVKNSNETEREFLNRIPSYIDNYYDQSKIDSLVSTLNSNYMKETLSDSLYGCTNITYQFAMTWLIQEYDPETGNEIDYYTPILIEVEYGSSANLKRIQANIDINNNEYTTTMSKSDIIFNLYIADDGSYILDDYEYYDWDIVEENYEWDRNTSAAAYVQAYGITYSAVAAYNTSTGAVIDTNNETIDDSEWTTLLTPIIDNTFYIKADNDYAQIQGPSFIINVDNPLTLEQIKSQLTATDPTEGNISDKIQIIENNYILTNGIIDVGTYYFIASVTDSSGNKSTKKFNIVVADGTAPTVTAMHKTIGNSSKLTEDELLSLFTYSDNYSSNLSVKIVSNEYSDNWNKPGFYDVTLRVTDGYLNSTEATAVITVTDTTNPMISAKNEIAANNVKLSEAEIKSLFTYSDDITSASDLTFEILTNNYNAGWSKPGTYTITARVTDKAGNSATATSTITVEDKTAPIVEGDDQTVGNNIQLSASDLTAFFTYSDDVTASNNLVTEIVSDDYSDNWNVPGTYDVELKVMDEAGNIAYHTLSVTVKDVINPVISGINKTVANNVKLSEAEIKELFTYSDETTAYDEIKFTITTNNYSSSWNVPGTYTITAQVEDEGGNKNTTSITIYVVDETKPLISGSNLTTGNNVLLTQEVLKSQFTYSDDTTASEELVFEIVGDNYTANYNIPGEWSVTARVTDANGNSSTCTIVVTVEDKTAPIVEGEDLITGNGNCLTQSELKLQFTYSDDITKESNLTIQIIADNYTSNYQTPGTYTVTARVMDESSNYTDKTINVTVEDKTNPVISGTNKTVGNSSKLTEANLKAQFTYSDDVSQTTLITLEIVEDNYTTNYSVPGNYNVTARVTDEAGNSSEATIIITVTDTTNPMIQGSAVNVSYANKLSLEELKALFTISDDVTQASDLVLKITTDNYSSNAIELGEYQVVAVVTDSAGNSATATSTITVVDDVAAVITAPETLKLNTLEPLTEEQLRAKISVVDTKDGELTEYELVDTNAYFTNYKIPGVYLFTINAEDSKGNTSTLTFSIDVVDEDFPIISWDSTYVINVVEGDRLTRDMIISMLISSGQLEDLIVTEVNSVYLAAECSVGTYAFKITGIDVNTQQQVTVTNLINVLASSETPGATTPEIPDTEEPEEPETPGATEPEGPENPTEENNWFDKVIDYCWDFENNPVRTTAILAAAALTVITLIVIIAAVIKRKK